MAQAAGQVAAVAIAAAERPDEEAKDGDSAREVEQDSHLGPSEEDVEDLRVAALDHPAVAAGQALHHAPPHLRRRGLPAGAPEEGVKVQHRKATRRAQAAAQDRLPGTSRPSHDDALHLTHPTIMG